MAYTTANTQDRSNVDHSEKSRHANAPEDAGNVAATWERCFNRRDVPDIPHAIQHLSFRLKKLAQESQDW